MGSIAQRSPWSALVWMLNGILVVTWLYGAGLAYQNEGIGRGLLAFFVPPYGAYYAYAEGVAREKVSEGSGSWADPALASDVAEFEKLCLSNMEYQQQSGMPAPHYAEFCLCVARAVVDLRTADELAYQQLTQQVSANFQRGFHRAQNSCRASSGFVRARPEPASDRE